jgi:hypothetical protein
MSIQEEDLNVVEFWLRKDPKRWVSGIISGCIAMGVALIVAGLFASSHGMEFTFPIKLFGTILSGASATETGNSSGIFSGLVFLGLVGGFWGLIYSHFVITNQFKPLLAMGLVWGIFLWIFNWNLYFQSFKTIRAADLSSGPLFPICLAYGLSLAVIGIVHPMISGSKEVTIH